MTVDTHPACLPSAQPAPEPNGEAYRESVCSMIDRAVGSWTVLHTRARCEKAVAGALQESSITHYLPLIPSVRTYGRRAVCFTKPLFPGYVFMCGGTRERDLAWRTRRVARVLQVANQNQIRAELRQISRVVESGKAVQLYPYLREGRRCRIMAGSLAGIEGVVLRRRSKSRMYISATVLGQSAVVEVDTVILEAVD